jgi:hypothetical protein
MNEIRVGPKTQLLALVGLIAAVAAAVAAQLPELRRYMKMESM